MANARTPSANLTTSPDQQGYPSRRTLEQPQDNPTPYAAPGNPTTVFAPQMTAPPPPQPETPGPSPAHFELGAIAGETDAHRSR